MGVRAHVDVPVVSCHFPSLRHSRGPLLEVTALCSDIPGSAGGAVPGGGGLVTLHLERSALKGRWPLTN